MPLPNNFVKSVTDPGFVVMIPLLYTKYLIILIMCSIHKIPLVFLLFQKILGKLFNLV